jgi:hypothetical protein
MPGSGEPHHLLADVAARQHVDERGRSRFQALGHRLAVSEAAGAEPVQAGSFGISHQHIEQGASDAIQKALADLRQALDENSDSELPFDVPELRELIQDGETEVRKENPNGTRLRATMSAIGSAIEYAPKLRTAYEAVKWACTFIGVTLP